MMKTNFLRAKNLVITMAATCMLSFPCLSQTITRPERMIYQPEVTSSQPDNSMQAAIEPGLQGTTRAPQATDPVHVAATAGTANATYLTLKAAFDAINAGTHQGVLTITIWGNTTETATAVLNASGSGSASYTSAILYPVSSGRIISGSIAAGPLITLNGADNVTIDGRVNATGSTKSLTIINTVAGGSTSTIRFINGACNNTVKYCVVKGSGNGTNAGILLFSDATSGTTGNSYNTIDNNDLTCASDANRPAIVIYSAGDFTPAKYNVGNTISNNNLYDFLRRDPSYGWGIYLQYNSTAWTITGNSFYETTSFATTGNILGYYLILIGSGNAHTITSNYFGGSGPSCAGTFTKTGNHYANLTIIKLEFESAKDGTIHGNVIKNFNWTSNYGWFYGILAFSGSGPVNIGSPGSPNIIGASSGNDAIIWTTTHATIESRFTGIRLSGPGTIDGNTIGGVTLNNASGFSSFYGIHPYGYGTLNISNNIIGSTDASTSNSIRTTSAASGAEQNVYGIYLEGYATTTISVSNNTLSKLTNGTTNATASTAGRINGIFTTTASNTNGTIAVSGNTVRNLTIGNANTYNDFQASVIGIAVNCTTGVSVTQNISGNTIYNLTNSKINFTGSIIGLAYSGMTTTTNLVSTNFIHSLSADLTATIYGLKIDKGATTYANNILNIGGSMANSVYGIYETGAASNNNNLYFNTVYIGGTASSGSNNSYALYSAVTTNNRNFRNNIFNNARQSTGSASGKHYAAYFATNPGATGLTQDYNDYYTPGTNGGTLGYFNGADVTTLNDWKTATGQDANSQAIIPGFTDPGGMAALDYTPSATSLVAVAGTGITSDYQGTVRSLVCPAMGAFEYSVTCPCANPNSGGTIAESQTICSGGNPAPFTSVAAPTGHSGTLEYKWQYSTDNWTTPVDIPSSNSATYAPPGPLTITTAYKRLARVTCMADWTGAAASNIVTLTLSTDPASQGGTVAPSATVCSGTNSTILTLSGHTGSIVKWQYSTDNWGTYTDVSNTTTSLTASNLTQTTSYRAVVQSGICTAAFSGTATVTVNPPTAAGSVTGGTPICSGNTSGVLTLTGHTGSIVKWQSSLNGTDWNDISNTSSTYTSGALTQTSQFRAVVKSGVCPEAFSGSTTVTVNNLPVATISGPSLVTTNSIHNYTTQTGMTGYLWTVTPATASITAGQGTYSVTVQFGISETYTITVTYVDGNGCSPATPASLIASTCFNPTGGGVIANEQLICFGETPLAFTSVSPASGQTGTLEYKWQVSTTGPGSGFSDIPSSNSETYAPGALTNTNYYKRLARVTCKNDWTGAAESNILTVWVYAQLVAGMASSSQTICYGTAPAQLSATAPTGGSENPPTDNPTIPGNNIIYQWQVQNGAGWDDISGASALTYSPGTLTSTKVYRQKQTDTYCTPDQVVYTNEVTIAINPLGQVNQPDNQVVCNGGSTAPVIFSTINIGGTTKYIWTNDNINIGLAAGGNVNIPSFTPLNPGTSPIIATISVTPTFSNGGVDCVGSTKTFTITVNPSGQVNQVQNLAFCNGNQTTQVVFQTINSGGTTAYNWTNDNASIGLSGSGSGNIPSFTAINNGIAYTTANFEVTPLYQNLGATCPGPPKTFLMIVNPSAQVNQPASQVFCHNATTQEVVFSTVNTSGTTSYNWTNDNPAIGLAAGGTGNIAPFVALNTGTVPLFATITVVPTLLNSVFCTGSSATFTITVNPAAQVTQPGNQVVCNGGATSAVIFETNNTGGTTTYAWTNNTPSIGLAASGNGNIASFTAQNPGNTPVVATITVTPTFSNGGIPCSGPAQSFTITVSPTGQVNQPDNQVVCNSGTTAPVTFGTINTVGTTTYAWTNDTPSIGLAASGIGNIAAFTAINSGAAPVVAIIAVTPSFTNGGVPCQGGTKTYTITVNPTGQVNQPANLIVCNGAATGPVEFTTTHTGGTTTYAWTNDNISIGLATSGNGNIGPFNATNYWSIPITAMITVTPTFTFGGVSCTGPTKSFTITVNPTTTVNPVVNQYVCNGSATLPVTFSGGLTGTVYSWTNSLPSIGLPESGSGNIDSFTAINTGSAPVAALITVTPVFINGVSCPGTPQQFTIHVNPSAQVNQASNQVLCHGALSTAVNFSTVNTGGTTTFAWTNSNPSIGLAAGGTGNIAPFNAINTSAVPQTAIITVVASFTANGITCIGPSMSFQITVNPQLVISPVANQVVCNGSPTNPVTFTGIPSGTSCTWTNSAPSIGLAASGTGDIPSFTAINSGSVPVVAVITVTPVYTNQGITCYGQPRVFTITVKPILPVSVSIDESANNICYGTTVTFLATPVNGGTAPVYNWFVNGMPIFFVYTHNLVFTPHDGDEVYCRLNSSDICVSGNPAESNHITMTVYPVLPASVTITPSANPVCNGATVNMTASAVNGGASPAFQWKRNGNNAGTNSPAYTFVPANGDVITCQLTSNLPCVTGNPATSNAVTFTVEPLPVAQLTGPAQACQGSAGNLYTTEGGMNNYAWTVPAGATVTSGGGTTDNWVMVTWNQPGQNTISVSYSTALGCNPLQPAQLVVNVTALKPVSVSIVSTATQVCQGTQVTFTAQPTNGGANPVYQWRVNGQNAGTSNAVYSYVPANGDVVDCMLTSGEICTTGNPATSNPIAMTVYQPAIPTIAGAALVCHGSSAVYTTQEGMLSYAWTVSAGGTITSGLLTNSITVTWNGSGAQSVAVNYTDIHGCRPSLASSMEVTVSALIPVSVSIGVSQNSVCQGTQVTFTATAVNPGTIPVYQWKVNGQDAGSNAPLFTYTPANGDVVVCQLTSNVPCAGGNPATSNPITMIVNPMPSIYQVTGGGAYCSGGNGVGVQLSSSQTGFDYILLRDYQPTGITLPGTGALLSFGLQTIQGTYTVQAINLATGCGDNMNGSAIVLVNQVPFPLVTGPTLVAAGSSGHVYTTEASMMNYTWTTSSAGVITGGGTATDNTATVTWNTVGLQWIRVNYTDPLTGCTGTSPGHLLVTVQPAPFITVLSPNGGETWQTGNSYSITWNSNVTENVKIELYKSSFLVSQITASTPPGVPFTWTVPNNLPSGNDYYIKIISTVFPGIYDLSDAHFTIENVIPATIAVQNMTIENGSTICLNALNTITVAGNGTTFTVMNGGSVTMIAGQKILYLPGTTVQHGGYLHGHIAPNGPWCGTQAPSIPNNTVAGIGDVQTVSVENWFKVFPNPTTGKFTLELSGESREQPVTCRIYNLLGEIISETSFSESSKHILDIEGRQPGIYLIKVTSGDRIGSSKVILKR